MANLLVSSSPHINKGHSIKGIMRDVCIALIPAVLVSIVVFGFYSLVLIGLSIGASVFGEYLYNKIRKKPQTIKDWSAVVTGLILALNLPPTVPVWVPIIGGLFATMIVKMLFGGIGKNFANPAMTARIFLVLAWGVTMATWAKPIELSNGFASMFEYFKYAFGDISNTINSVTSATPMNVIKKSIEVKDLAMLKDINIGHMFVGYTGGCLGETSSIALIIGGIYLIAKHYLDWKIPVLYIGTVALLTLIDGVQYVLPSVFGGGLILGAFFMASDYSTSPNTKIGVIIYAVMLGILTYLFRKFSKMPEGVSFSILFMNILVPLIDKYIIPPSFGVNRKVMKAKMKAEKAKKLEAKTS